MRPFKTINFRYSLSTTAHDAREPKQIELGYDSGHLYINNRRITRRTKESWSESTYAYYQQLQQTFPLPLSEFIVSRVNFDNLTDSQREAITIEEETIIAALLWSLFIDDGKLTPGTTFSLYSTIDEQFILVMDKPQKRSILFKKSDPWELKFQTAHRLVRRLLTT